MTDGSVQPFKDRRAAPVNTAGQFRRGAEPLIAAAYERLVGPKETFRPDRSGEITDRHVAALLGVDIVMARWAAQVSYAASDAVAYMLDGLWTLEQHLPRGTKEIELERSPAIAGTVDWGKTLRSPGVSRDGGEEYRCTVRCRTNDLPPARLLKGLLQEVSRSARLVRTGPFAAQIPEHVAATLRTRSRAAREAMNGRFLSDVTADISLRNVRDVKRARGVLSSALLGIRGVWRQAATPETLSWFVTEHQLRDIAEFSRASAAIDRVSGSTSPAFLERGSFRMGPARWASGQFRDDPDISPGLWMANTLFVFDRFGESEAERTQRAISWGGGSPWMSIGSDAELDAVVQRFGQDDRLIRNQRTGQSN